MMNKPKPQLLKLSRAQVQIKIRDEKPRKSLFGVFVCFCYLNHRDLWLLEKTIVLKILILDFLTPLKKNLSKFFGKKDQN